MTGNIDNEQDHLYRLTEIDWDTDGETIPDLPQTIDVRASDEHDALDVASDEVGWCIEQCVVEHLRGPRMTILAGQAEPDHHPKVDAYPICETIIR